MGYPKIVLAVLLVLAVVALFVLALTKKIPINPLSWILGLGYTVFSLVTIIKIANIFRLVEPVFFNRFLLISLILLTLYSLSGEIWPHKYSFANDVSLTYKDNEDENNEYNETITPNLIVGLMGVNGFMLASRTGSVAGWALLAMVSFLTFSVLSFHLPQFIHDWGAWWRLAAIGGVLMVKVALTLYFMSEIKKSSVQG